MTEEQRRDEFNSIWLAMPGRPIDRLRAVASALHCKENTVRIWRLKSPTGRVIPEQKLMILRDRVAGK